MPLETWVRGPSRAGKHTPMEKDTCENIRTITYTHLPSNSWGLQGLASLNSTPKRPYSEGWPVLVSITASGPPWSESMTPLSSSTQSGSPPD